MKKDKEALDKKQKEIEKEFNWKYKKRDNVLKKNKIVDSPKAIDFFYHNNLKIEEPDYCRLFENDEMCHDIPSDKMVCWDCFLPIIRLCLCRL